MTSTSKLFTAIETGNLQSVREILEEIEDVDVDVDTIRGAWNRTPLHQACLHRKPQIVKYLIEEQKASVNVVDEDGWNPLYRTCALFNNERTMEIVELLLANGVDVNAKAWDSCGDARLHQACRGGHTQLVQVLLNHGANINAQDTDGRTALFHACDCAYLDMIKLLLANNADRHIKTNNGDGPADLFRWYRQEELIESYDKWPLAVSGVEENATYTQGASVMLNPRLSQHQHAIGMKTLLLVQQLPVHEVAYEILGYLSPAAVEKIMFLPTV